MSVTPHPLDILFLTNFSDFCFRTIPSIAQMADELPVRLTLLNAYDPETTTPRQATETLRSFFPEADRYRSCRRVSVAGPLVSAVRRYLEIWPVNLIVAPASDSIGFPASVSVRCGRDSWTRASSRSGQWDAPFTRRSSPGPCATSPAGSTSTRLVTRSFRMPSRSPGALEPRFIC